MELLKCLKSDSISELQVWTQSRWGIFPLLGIKPGACLTDRQVLYPRSTVLAPPPHTQTFEMEFYYVVQSSLDLDSSELSTSASQLVWTTGIVPHAQLQSNFQCFSKM
jgi:hypothetical protein